MGKNKKRGNKEVSDTSLKSMKQGFVQKKKNQKFKRTPAGKVPLINGSNKQNNGKKQNGKNGSPQKNPPKNNENNKNLNKKKVEKTEEDVDSESEEDINEGIKLEEEHTWIDSDDEFKNKKDSSVSSDQEDDSTVYQSDTEVLKLLGASLGENSDDDDGDFKEDHADDVAEENKGVKKFKGVPSESDGSDGGEGGDGGEGSDSSKEDSSNYSEDEAGSDLNTSSSLMNSEFDSDEDDDDDEEEEEDDQESDESDDEEAEESELGLKTLVAGSDVTDDEDDEDFDSAEEDDEDEDISDEDEDEGNAKSKKNKAKKNKAEKELLEKSTIYIGNLPKEVKKTQLHNLFKKFGDIKNMRIRGTIPEDEKMSKRVAAITNKTHPRVKTCYAYITFEEEASAEKALSLNGSKFLGNYLRVDKAAKPEEIKYDPKRCVFIGNLSFNLDVNSVWDHFKDCGEIESVRLIKDKKTGIGRGFGYVNFKDTEDVALALELDGTTLAKRELRVRVCTTGNPSKNNERKKRSISTGSEDGSSKANQENAVRRKKQKLQNSPNKQGSPHNKGAFQGQKADAKKKMKMNKQNKKKEAIAKMLTAKGKKSV